MYLVEKSRWIRLRRLNHEPSHGQFGSGFGELLGLQVRRCKLGKQPGWAVTVQSPVLTTAAGMIGSPPWLTWQLDLGVSRVIFAYRVKYLGIWKGALLHSSGNLKSRFWYGGSIGRAFLFPPLQRRQTSPANNRHSTLKLVGMLRRCACSSFHTN